MRGKQKLKLKNIEKYLVMKLYKDIKFPLILIDEEGETHHYEDIPDLECNLEDFDSNTDLDFVLTDSNGNDIFLVMKLTRIQELRLK